MNNRRVCDLLDRFWANNAIYGRKAENPAGQAHRDKRECPWKYTWEKESPIAMQARRLHATRIVTSTRVARSRLSDQNSRITKYCCDLLRFIKKWKFPEWKFYLKSFIIFFFIIVFESCISGVVQVCEVYFTLNF